LTDQQRKRYTKEFKKEAVELVSNQGYTVIEAARNLGINDGMLGRWRREQLKDQQHAFPGTGHQSVEAEELKRLRRYSSPRSPGKVCVHLSLSLPIPGTDMLPGTRS
jgi:transposase